MPAQAEACRVVIVGAGIAGLAAAILFRRLGHSVLVLERRGADYVSHTAGGIDLSYNSLRIIQNVDTAGLDLARPLRDIGDEFDHLYVKRYDSGEVLRRVRKTKPACMVHRADLLRILHDRAVQSDVEIRTEQVISSIDDSGDHAIIRLHDGLTLEAGLVIGADGLESQVRRLIFPNCEKDTTPIVRDDCTLLVNVPRSLMLKYPETASLYGRPPYEIWLGPGREIVGWTMTTREVYHLQFCDHHYDGRNYGVPNDGQPSSNRTDPPAWIKPFTDMASFRKHWSDFDASIRTVLASASDCVRWRIGAVPSTLDTWHSANKRVVLVGDAAHAFPPFAGQGANQALEDVAALAALVSLSRSRATSLSRAVEVWQEVRRPRIAGIREIVESNIKMFSMADGEKQKKRDEMLKQTAKERAAAGALNGSGNSQSMAIKYKWTENYDAVQEARDLWSKMVTMEEPAMPAKL